MAASWTVAPPRLGDADPREYCDPEGGELAGLRWSGRRVVAVRLARPDIVDGVVDGCDLSGVVTDRASVRRLTVTDTRLRDCTFAGGIVQDVSVEGCTGERLSLRFATLQRVVVTGCTWPGLDLYGATLDRVLFTDCDLTGAAFDALTVTSARFQRCTLTNATGALSLRGAEVDLADLATLGPSLARESGIVLR